jgi:hypothetical protein
LKQAATGTGNVASLLKQACEYRVSRETIMALSKNNRKKAARDIHKLYKIGFSKDKLQNLIQHTYLAKKKITQRPRYIGLGIGLLTSTAIHYYWFIGGTNASVATGYPENIQFIMNGIPFTTGLFTSVLAIKVAGIFSLQKVMKAVNISSNKIPPAGKAGIYALIGNIALTAGLIAGKITGLY